MVRMFKPLALVGAALIVSSAPAFAEDLNLFNPMNLDLDPLHIFTPAPAPAPAPEAMMRMKNHRGHHKMMKKKKMMKPA